MSWKPLLEGALAEEADASVSRIAKILAGEDLSALGPSLGEGLSGIALFFGYLSKARGEERFGELAQARLEQAIDQMAVASLRTGLFNGISGVAWTSQHLEELLSGSADPDANEQVDEILGDFVRSTPWRWDFDLLHGITGIAGYALDHSDPATARALLGPIVERLGELAIHREPGVCWWTSPQMLPPKMAQRYPRGLFDLGVAHGTAGILGVLGRICGTAAPPEGTRPLLDGAVRWLLANKRPEDGGSTFSRYAAPSRPYRCRSAWCYGDPGIAAALLGASRGAGEPSWEREAIAIARKDCQRPNHEKEVVDATLCHGAAGLGHLYNRLAQATGEDLFAEAARSWFEQAILLPTAGRQDLDRVPLPSGFLEGLAGMGLALLAATSSLEPAWDRPMLLSGRIAGLEAS